MTHTKTVQVSVITTLLLFCAGPLNADTAILGETVTAGNYFNTVDRIRGIVRTAVVDGTLDSIYVHVANVQPGAVAKGVLYDSTTLELVDSTAEKALATDGGSFHWEGFSFVNSGSIDSSKTYLLGIFIGPVYVGVGRDPATDSRYYGDYTYAGGVPETLPEGAWATDQVHSIYVVYTVSTGPTTPISSRRRRLVSN